MMPEAEELLSDICRFYSEDQWLELSAPSYALLADCQRNLHLEDQYLSSSIYAPLSTSLLRSNYVSVDGKQTFTIAHNVSALVFFKVIPVYTSMWA